MRKIYLSAIILGAVVFTSCSKYGYVTLNYPQAPAAYLPNDIHRIAVVNRSLTKEEDKKSKIIEAIASSEVMGSDKLASDECLKGVYDGMKEWGGAEITYPKKTRMMGTGTREAPDILDWDTVGFICTETEADALLVLETFDSNTDLLLSTASEKVSTLLSGNVPSVGVAREGTMNVFSYWRLYDPRKQTVVDQFQHTNYVTFETRNNVPPLNILPESAYASGHEYVNRFLPTYYKVKRQLYKKGKGKTKQDFKVGWRRAEVANWEGAIEKWTKVSEQGKSKSAGRACLDIAVAYEVLGNTKEALEWAKRSYEDYGDKLGRDYAKILLRRQKLE